MTLALGPRHSLRVGDVGAALYYLSRDTFNKTAALRYEKGTAIALPCCNENINTLELPKASQPVPFTDADTDILRDSRTHFSIGISYRGHVAGEPLLVDHGGEHAPHLKHARVTANAMDIYLTRACNP